MIPLAIFAVTSKETGCVTPCMVSSPWAVAVIFWPSAGTEPRSIGVKRRNVAVGYVAASMMLPVNCESLFELSLLIEAISISKTVLNKVVSWIVSDPLT